MRPPKPKDRAAQMIIEHLEDIGATRAGAAKKWKISQSLLNKILCGNRSLTWRLARVIERGSQQALTAAELMEASEEALED